MNAAYVEFARALELVCRHLNPPHQPLPAVLPLADLGLEGAQLRADDRGIAYRYLRGLEVAGVQDSALDAKPIWVSERGLLSAATALAEIEPGILAAADPYGVIRLFVRASRARWECLSALPSHQGAVHAIIPLQGGGFASAGADGYVVTHQRDQRGQWRFNCPATRSSNQPTRKPVPSCTAHSRCVWLRNVASPSMSRPRRYTRSVSWMTVRSSPVDRVASVWSCGHCLPASGKASTSPWLAPILTSLPWRHTHRMAIAPCCAMHRRSSGSARRVVGRERNRQP
jgi:hypothetical protein